MWNYVARDKTQTLQVRLYRLTCLMSGCICLTAILPLVPETALAGEDLGSMVTRLMKHPEQHEQIESETIGRDGRRIRISWAQQPVYDDHNQLQEILGVVVDVTERAAVLERLLMTQETMDSAPERPSPSCCRLPTTTSPSSLQ